MTLPEKAKRIYQKNQWKEQAQRYHQTAERFLTHFGAPHQVIFSAPGRSEICGNHTDHNMGKAVGAAVTLDILAMVSPRKDGLIRIISEAFPPIEVRSGETALLEQEKGSSAGLVRGICHQMEKLGYQIGGFDAFTDSQVLKGSGLSSSAAFEVLTVSILDHLYNKGAMPPKQMAQIAQYAENVYFGKASGMLDQLSCAYGGMIEIDFKDPSDPKVTPLSFNFPDTGYSMVITDVHSDHSDLTADYTAIRSEMQEVAHFFKKEHLREVSPEEFYTALPRLNQALSERALVRAGHFFQENLRVEQIACALKQNDFEGFKALVKESGASSQMYLQNIYSDRNATSQAATLALQQTERLLKDCGAWRIHGGGFGGTIQAFLPHSMVEDYINEMEGIFGKGCSFPLQIRPYGPILIK